MGILLPQRKGEKEVTQRISPDIHGKNLMDRNLSWMRFIECINLN